MDREWRTGGPAPSRDRTSLAGHPGSADHSLGGPASHLDPFGMAVADDTGTLQGNGQRSVTISSFCACGPPMAKNSPLFRGHGAGTRAAAAGGAGKERADAGSSATCFISLNILFVSQGYCASRPTIYDERAKPVMSVF